jgi:hypothetical protein
VDDEISIEIREKEKMEGTSIKKIITPPNKDLKDTALVNS